MSRLRNRIWVRFALGIILTILITIGILTTTVFICTKIEFERFYADLPSHARHEMEELIEQGQHNSPQMINLYNQYWRGDPWEGEQLALIMGILFCIPFALIAGLWISHLITLPVNSIAEAAKRISVGDFSVRAHSHHRRDEMAELVKHFNSMADSLEALEHERRATAAAISHELRTPLAILQARLQALCDEVIPGSPVEFRKLLEQAEHLGRLVDDLHTLSVADAGRLSLHTEWVDLPKLAQDVLDKYANRLHEYGMTTDFIVEEADLHIQADSDRLRQVLNNLIENALRYARHGHWLEVRMGRDQHSAIIKISDAGPGIPASIRENLFQRFYRVERSRNRATGGTGLGLAIVKTLVTLHGGQISAETSLKGGASFEIRLPINRFSKA